jgi:hypothetical protein
MGNPLTLSDLFCAHQALVREVAHYNARITDGTTPDNQKRNAITEIRALHPELAAVQ